MEKMFTVINAWNLLCPSNDRNHLTDNIKLRGYDKEAFLTGEFARKLANEDIRPLSVSNIADKYCATRRDLYFYKGVNRLAHVEPQEIWGGKAGYIVEEYIQCILGHENNNADDYTSLIRECNDLNSTFVADRNEKVLKLRQLEESSSSAKKGDTDWFFDLLRNTGRAELGIRILHSILKENNSLDTKHVKIKQEIKPHITEIGINSPASPDFIVPDFGIAGDIKTGFQFEPHHILTCAGYALAYENWKKEKTNIDWGIIYFFPTRNPSKYVRPVTFTQIYIFPIDDRVRRWFLDVRDEAYSIISKKMLPMFPQTDKRKQCLLCRFKEQCIREGVELDAQE